jgi:hypothetical protein
LLVAAAATLWSTRAVRISVTAALNHAEMHRRDYQRARSLLPHTHWLHVDMGPQCMPDGKTENVGGGHTGSNEIASRAPASEAGPNFFLPGFASRVRASTTV